jgi:hypothetical protein
VPGGLAVLREEERARLNVLENEVRVPFLRGFDQNSRAERD